MVLSKYQSGSLFPSLLGFMYAQCFKIKYIVSLIYKENLHYFLSINFNVKVLAQLSRVLNLLPANVS